MSAELNNLTANVRQLVDTFLNYKSNVNGKYTKKQLLQCRSYITFGHAEIEHYFETVGLRVLDRALDKWNAKGRIDRVIGCLLAFRQKEVVAVPDDITQPKGHQKISTIIHKAAAAHRNIIRTNNGIKPTNFSDIFTPLGVDDSHVASAFMIQLNNIGTSRGLLAHTSGSVSLQNLRDPITVEKVEIDYLLMEIKKFDSILTTLC
jgi:hypothetical protein